MRVFASFILCLLILLCSVSTSAGPAIRVIGKPAPELTIDYIIQPPDGTTITLEALRGKAVVLEFWATWCGPCIDAIPHVNVLVEKFQGRPLQFLSVSSEEPEKVRAFVLAHPMKA